MITITALGQGWLVTTTIRGTEYARYCVTEQEIEDAKAVFRLYAQPRSYPYPTGKYKPAMRDQFGRRIERNGEGA